MLIGCEQVVMYVIKRIIIISEIIILNKVLLLSEKIEVPLSIYQAGRYGGLVCHQVWC